MDFPLLIYVWRSWFQYDSSWTFCLYFQWICVFGAPSFFFIRIQCKGSDKIMRGTNITEVRLNILIEGMKQSVWKCLSRACFIYRKCRQVWRNKWILSIEPPLHLYNVGITQSLCDHGWVFLFFQQLLLLLLLHMSPSKYILLPRPNSKSTTRSSHSWSPWPCRTLLTSTLPT